MTLDEIQKMSDWKVNVAIAEQVMGWRWFGRTSTHKSVCWLLRPNWLQAPGASPQDLDVERERPAFETDGQLEMATRNCGVPPCCTSLDACHAAEERLGEMGRCSDFVAALEEIVHDRCDGNKWDYTHATARQRAEAILLTMQKDS